MTLVTQGLGGGNSTEYIEQTITVAIDYEATVTGTVTTETEITGEVE